MDKEKVIPEKDENGLQGHGGSRDHHCHTNANSDYRDEPRSEDGGVLRSLPLVTAYGHKDGPLVLGALRIVSH